MHEFSNTKPVSRSVMEQSALNQALHEVAGRASISDFRNSIIISKKILMVEVCYILLYIWPCKLHGVIYTVYLKSIIRITICKLQIVTRIIDFK